MQLMLGFIYGEYNVLLGFAILLLTRGQKMKPHFPTRLCLSVGICAVSIVFFVHFYFFAERFHHLQWFYSLCISLPYVIILVNEVIIVRLCTYVSMGTAVFSALAGYSIKQFSECVLYLLTLIPSFPTLEMARTEGQISPVISYYAIKWGIYSVVYAAVFVFVLRKNREKWLYSVNTKPSVYALSFASFFTCNLFTILQGDYRHIPIVYIMCVLYNMLCCLQMLFIRIGVYEQDTLTQQMDTMRRIWMEKESQTQLFRENIEMINIKYHDLKRSVELLKEDHTGGIAGVISDIEKTLDIYDSEYNTGNTTLDTVLTQYHLQCERHHIRFSCMADGYCLDFMSSANLVALFGNILENAVEASLELPEVERFISLSIRSNGSVISIHEENATAHPLVMRNRLPVSSKAHTDYHGYGMKSIRMIAEMYHGVMSVSKEEQCFVLNLLLIPDRKKDND